MVDAATATAIFDACVNVNNAACTASNRRTDANGYAWFDPPTSQITQYTFGFSRAGYDSTTLIRNNMPGMGTVTFTIFMRRTGT